MRHLITELQQESPGSVSWCIPKPLLAFMECHDMKWEAQVEHFPVIPTRRKADWFMRSSLIAETM